MTILDQTSDTSGRETSRIFQVYDPPEYVKTASAAQLCGSGDRDFNKFADVDQRAYPCHNAAAVWTSAAFLFDKAASVQPAPVVEERIMNAARYFGIESDVLRLKTAAETHKDASEKLSDNDFAFVWIGEDGQKQRHLPIRNGLEAKEASAWFVKYRDNLVVPDQVKVARRILEKAAAFGAGIDTDVEQTLNRAAGYGVCAVKRASEFVRSRADLMKEPTVREAMLTLAGQLDTNPEATKTAAMRLKVAETIDALDRQFKLTGRYGQDLERPIDRLFEVTEVMAKQAATDLIRMTTGTVYRKQALELVKLADISDYMGSELADAITTDGLLIDYSKAAAVLPTLPRGDAETFDNLVSERGVRPVMKTAADQQGLTRADLMQLATS